MAIGDYTKAIELDPNNANWQHKLAWLLATCSDLKLRDPRRAVDGAKKAVEISPKEGLFWQTLAWAEYRGGDWKSAVVAIEKVKELGSSGDSFEWFLLAMAHWQLGDKERARQLYDRARVWMDKNQATNEELRRFRAEAAQVLGVDKKED